jgi:uncharacterized ion transporter superfamily protein YfcC
MDTDFENYLLKSYSICQKHVDYLYGLNPNNSSIALRQSLDRLIKIDEQKTKHERLLSFKDNMIIISIGMIFLLYGVLSSEWWIALFSLGFGIFFAVFGITTLKVRKT